MGGGCCALAAMRKADPDGASKYDRLELAEGMKGQLMLGSPDHPLLAYVALPKDWQKGKTYPVFVGAEGAACGILGYFNAASSTQGFSAAIVGKGHAASRTRTRSTPRSTRSTTRRC